MSLRKGLLYANAAKICIGSFVLKIGSEQRLGATVRDVAVPATMGVYFTLPPRLYFCLCGATNSETRVGGALEVLISETSLGNAEKPILLPHSSNSPPPLHPLLFHVVSRDVRWPLKVILAILQCCRWPTNSMSPINKTSAVTSVLLRPQATQAN